MYTARLLLLGYCHFFTTVKWLQKKIKTILGWCSLKNNLKQIVLSNFARCKKDKKIPNPGLPWLFFCRQYHHYNENSNSGCHINSMPLQPSDYILQNPRKPADTLMAPYNQKWRKLSDYERKFLSSIFYLNYESYLIFEKQLTRFNSKRMK